MRGSISQHGGAVGLRPDVHPTWLALSLSRSLTLEAQQRLQHLTSDDGDTDG